MMAVLLLAVSVAAAAFADLASSSKAMACCAKAHHQCARLESPDNCCKSMGHGVAGPTTATVTTIVRADAPSTVVASMPTTTITVKRSPAGSAAAVDSKRLHDPPHLHGFPLLI